MDLAAFWTVVKESATSILEAAIAMDSKRAERKTQLEKLIAAYESESLVLVLGAGASISYGLPDWNTLLQSLLLSATFESPNPLLGGLFTKVFNPSPLVAARFVRNHHKNRIAGKSFESITKEIIYKGFKTDMHSSLMKEICALVLAPARSPMLDSIITYNFDDVLEREVRRLGQEIGIDIPIRTISGPESRLTARELPIYHVHGYLPLEGSEPIKHPVTLGEADYHQQYAQVYRWENIVQINKFSDAHCLFIGTSFTDPNLRRLLDIAKDQHGDDVIRHYVMRKIPALDEITRIIRKLQDDDDPTANGSSNQEADSELARSLIAIHKQFEENDARSFNVGVIWINDHAEIPEILASIRCKDASSFAIAGPQQHLAATQELPAPTGIHKKSSAKRARHKTAVEN